MSLVQVMANPKTIVFFVNLILLACTHLQKDQPVKGENLIKKDNLLTGIEFDKVVAYDFAGDTEIPLIDSNKRITTKVSKKKILSDNQIEELKMILADSSAFGGDQPLDFYPNLGIVFYNNDEIVHHFEISLPCNGISGTIEIIGLTSRQYPNAGFSGKGREKIYFFCKKLGFTQYLDKKKWCCILPE
jgi:hypothetical protein